jgi:hypothetical protein
MTDDVSDRLIDLEMSIIRGKEELVNSSIRSKDKHTLKVMIALLEIELSDLSRERGSFKRADKERGK